MILTKKHSGLIKMSRSEPWFWAKEDKVSGGALGVTHGSLGSAACPLPNLYFSSEVRPSQVVLNFNPLSADRDYFPFFTGPDFCKRC